MYYIRIFVPHLCSHSLYKYQMDLEENKIKAVSFEDCVFYSMKNMQVILSIFIFIYIYNISKNIKKEKVICSCSNRGLFIEYMMEYETVIRNNVYTADLIFMENSINNRPSRRKNAHTHTYIYI